MIEERRSLDVGRLRLLAEKANREHSQAQRAAGQAVEHAVEAGGLLLKAKEEVGHGNFMKWVEENFEGSERVSRKYMRLATAADQNRIDPEEVASLAEAERLLRDQDAQQTPGEYEPEVPGEEYDFWDRGAESEPEEPNAESEPPPQPPKGPSPSKKKDVDPLRDAMMANGRALRAASDEQRTEWAQLLHDDIDIYMGSLDQEEAA